MVYQMYSIIPSEKNQDKLLHLVTKNYRKITFGSFVPLFVSNLQMTEAHIAVKDDFRCRIGIRLAIDLHVREGRCDLPFHHTVVSLAFTTISVTSSIM